MIECLRGLLVETPLLQQPCELPPRDDKKPGNEDRFRHPSIARGGRLEGFVRISREGVQVEAVVPIGPADERKPVEAEVRDGVLKGDAKVIEEEGVVAVPEEAPLEEAADVRLSAKGTLSARIDQSPLSLR